MHGAVQSTRLVLFIFVFHDGTSTAYPLLRIWLKEKDKLSATRLVGCGIARLKAGAIQSVGYWIRLQGRILA